MNKAKIIGGREPIKIPMYGIRVRMAAITPKTIAFLMPKIKSPTVFKMATIIMIRDKPNT